MVMSEQKPYVLIEKGFTGAWFVKIQDRNNYPVHVEASTTLRGARRRARRLVKRWSERNALREKIELTEVGNG